MRGFWMATLLTAAAVGASGAITATTGQASCPLVVLGSVSAMAATHFWGIRAGLWATTLAALACPLFHVEPWQLPVRFPHAGLVEWFAVVVCSLVGVWLVALVRNATASVTRPRFTHFGWLAAFVVANVDGGGLGQGLKLIPGVSIIFWPPSGVFVAALLLAHRRTWLWWSAGACAAELLGNLLWYQNPLHLALLYFAANAATALTAALLVRRAVARQSCAIHPRQLDGPRQAFLFVLLAGGIAPAVGATIIATVDTLLGKHAFVTAWHLVWLGDGTGLLLSAPLVLRAVYLWRGRRLLSLQPLVEFIATCSLAVLVTWLALESLLPTVYLALPAIVWAAVRFQIRGASVVLTAVILTVAVFTRSGIGEFTGSAEQMHERMVALQVFLGVCASTALIVAALSAQHVVARRRLWLANLLLERRIAARTDELAASEARWKTLLTLLPVGVYACDSDGRLNYFNPRAAELWGRSPRLGDDNERFCGSHRLFLLDGRPLARHETPVNAALTRGDSCRNAEAVAERPDGSRVVVSINIDPIRHDGQIAGAIISLNDITERKQIEEQLRASEQHLRMALAAANTGIWEWNMRTNALTWSPEVYALYGLPPTDTRPVLDDFQRLVHPDDLERVWQIVQYSIDNHAPYSSEFRIVRPDGATRWIYDLGKVDYDDAGRPLRLSGTLTDITDRKLAQLALQQSHARLSEVLQVEAVGVMFWDLTTGRLVDANDTFCRLMGYSREVVEAGDLTWQKLTPPEYHELSLAEIGKFQTSGRIGPYEKEYLRKDGSRLWLLFSGSSLGDQQCVEFCVDISQRKAAEEQLRQRLRQLDLLAFTAQRLLMGRQRETDYLDDIFAAMQQLLGMESCYHFRQSDDPRVLQLATSLGTTEAERQQFGTMRFGELLCGRVAETQARLIVEDLQHTTQPGAEVLRAHGATSYIGFPLVVEGKLWGTVAFISSRVTHFCEGDVQAIQTACDQIAAALDRSRLLDELAASEERLRLALEGADLGSWDIDLRTGATTWNRRHATLQGYADPVPASLERWRELVHPDDLPAVMTAIEFARGARAPLAIEHRLHRADSGEERWLALYGRFIYDDAGEAIRFSGVSRDVTDRRRAEQQSRLSAERLQLAQDAAGIGIHDYDVRTGRVEWDARVRELWGVEPDEPITFDTFLAGVHPDDRAATQAAVDRALDPAGDGHYAAEYRVIHRHDGCERWVTALGHVTFVDGHAVRLVGTVQDTTARREADERVRTSEQRLRYYFEFAPASIAVFDQDMRYLYANRRWRSDFRLGDDDLTGRSHYDIFPDIPERWREVHRRGLQGEVIAEDEDCFERADGSVQWLRWEVRPWHIGAGNQRGIIIYSEDISERKQVLEQLRDADRKKDEFLATLAHELRNPLAPVRNGLQIMKLAENNPQTLEATRAMMERQVNQMAHLIDDLMDLSRISRGKIALQKTRLNLADAVESALDTSRPLVEARGHRLEVDLPTEPIYLEADLTRLSQIFANLINNAAKYTDEGGQIRVAAERHGSDVLVSVEDNGVGIAPGMLTAVFDMFAQVDRSLEKSQGGLGIGLNIVKRLVEKHGGQITADSAGHGHGSKFTVQLPALASMAEDPVERGGPAPPERAARRRILVVDDNRDSAATLAMMLGLMGNETQTAHDGFAAIAAAESFRPELILMDIGMPGLNGLDACRRIRSHAWGRSMVLVACSGWGQEDDRQRSREVGFDLHLVKPINLAELDRLVAQPRIP